ncbi:hypothetical protein UJ101_02308 [Flavobacteriaceae bacterium UJ101]|nr:hypothetical protein UJ101_02308 [Flavobacteriaceae bacterium UJ101]
MKKHLYIIPLLFFLIGCSSDWDENFDSKKTKAFSTKVLENETSTLFPDKKFTIIKKNFIDDIIENEQLDPTGNYIALDSNFNMNKRSIDELLAFVEEGNIAFIATHQLNYTLEEALGVNLTIDFPIPISEKDDDYTLSFVAQNLQQNHYFFERYLHNVSIQQYNDQTTSVLGYFENEIGNKKVNFVRIIYGDGAFYIHTQPLVFTNFYLLNDPSHSQYVSNCFSYLREDHIFWDNYNISKRSRSKTYEELNSNNQPEAFSELDYFLENDSLRMTLYSTLIGFGLFLLFKVKRKQRIIPFIPPVRNTSVDFTKTISNLYLNNKSNEDIASKKLTFFYEKIRTELRISTQHINDTFLKNLEQKTGLSRKEINDLFITIRKTNDKIKGQILKDDDLLRLDQAIHTFYTKTKLL